MLIDKQQSTEHLEEIELKLNEADELAKSPETLDKAHVIWAEILNGYIGNDFLQIQVQRAETGRVSFPKRPEDLPSEPTEET